MQWLKTWYTAEQIAELKLPGIPTTRQGVLLRAKKYKWPCRPYGDKENGAHSYCLLLVILEAEFECITPDLQRELQARIETLEIQHKQAGDVIKSLNRLWKSKGVFLAQKAL